jgi:hypothetical protein
MENRAMHRSSSQTNFEDMSKVPTLFNFSQHDDNTVCPVVSSATYATFPSIVDERRGLGHGEQTIRLPFTMSMLGGGGLVIPYRNEEGPEEEYLLLPSTSTSTFSGTFPIPAEVGLLSLELVVCALLLGVVVVVLRVGIIKWHGNQQLLNKSRGSANKQGSRRGVPKMKTKCSEGSKGVSGWWSWWTSYSPIFWRGESSSSCADERIQIAPDKSSSAAAAYPLDAFQVE